MNEDVSWSLGEDEFGTYILLDDAYTGETPLDETLNVWEYAD